jgi:1-aminocyclopropane-1-carboxylate deaminase
LENSNQTISSHSPEITLAIKREDLIHPFVSGNKYRKLKYNLLEAKAQNKPQILTFGGAFSNHIAAVAAAGKEAGMQTIGVIRGEELAAPANENPTLRFAQECGMQLEFVSRETYRLKSDSDFVEKLRENFGDFYLLPEGGTNNLAVKGCEEILTDADAGFDYICCAVGTGGTISGLINSAKPHQQVLGFPALKGDFLKAEIRKFARQDNWDLISDYHFGGYAKVNADLIDFMNGFYKENAVPLDPIYTGKMVFGVMDLIQKGYFPKTSKILMIHTGGIQGISGMNLHLKNIKSPLIDYHD